MMEDYPILEAIHNLEKRFEVFEAKVSKDSEFLRELLINQRTPADKNSEEIEGLKIRMAEQDSSYQTTIRNRSLLGAIAVGVIALFEIAIVAYNILVK